MRRTGLKDGRLLYHGITATMATHLLSVHGIVSPHTRASGLTESGSGKNTSIHSPAVGGSCAADAATVDGRLRRSPSFAQFGQLPLAPQR